MTVGIGLFGHNGHQLPVDKAWDGAEVVAVCGMPTRHTPHPQHDSFDALLADTRVHLVSICAPRRDQQGDYIRQALLAGKHVYAEKPALMCHADIVDVLALAHHVGCHFFEMTGTVDEAPYALVASLMAQRTIGELGHVLVRKSYPYADWRPQDEGIDGGLIMQCGIHALRMVTHLTGHRIVAISAVESAVGNPVTAGGLHLAASMSARLDNHAVVSVATNYHNPRGHARWADDELRLYGSDGMIMTNHQHEVHVVTHDAHTTLTCPEQPPAFQHVIDVIRKTAPRKRDVVWDMHPTHAVIAAKASAMHSGQWMDVP
ncbi:MAG: Gfo/Idh/MocA family oxidoreductase [Chloroflexi bacterium]|nr:Gfo/Idh/MocA family oxidoreductase [Chloroflexota bacterium]